MTKAQSVKRAVLLMCLLGGIVLLSGCEGKKRPLPEVKQDIAKEIAKTPAQKEAERLARYQKELDALKGVALAQYDTYRQEFGGLMSGAAQYAGLRSQVNDGTQATVDALYRYRVNLPCSDISQATLKGLLERGERTK